MGKSIIVGLVLLSFIMIPGIAGADFFNGGPWYMESDWWGLYEDDDPEGRTGLAEVGDNLEFTVDDEWTDRYGAIRSYSSEWAFKLDDDFEFSVDFHYDHIGTSKNDEAGVMIGLRYFAEGETDPYTIGIGADNWWSSEGGHQRGYFLDTNIYGSEINSWWKRSENDGRFYVSYDVKDDRLTVTAFDWDSSEESYSFAGANRYAGLKNDVGLEHLGVFLGGWSDGADLDSGEAYLTNFQVTKGTMIPEPASTVLFLVGGISLAAARLRKRRK